MMDDPTSSEGARVPDEDSQHGVAGMCSRCRKIVDLSKPLTREGWQAVHNCGSHCIEAMPIKPGGPPWAWRARNIQAEG